MIINALFRIWLALSIKSSTRNVKNRAIFHTNNNMSDTSEQIPDIGNIQGVPWTPPFGGG